MIRVLYAEDDASVADLVRLYFSPSPATELTVVPTGTACLAALATETFDALLLDLGLPDRDGLSVLAELASRGDPTPVVIVSGQGQAELAVRALRAGAADCIDKNSPDFPRLAEIVRHIVARHRRRPHLLPSTTASPAPRVLFIDSDHEERAAAARFFAAHAPRLHLVADAPAALDPHLRREPGFAAVILGPHLAATPLLDALRHLRPQRDTLPALVLAGPATAEAAIAAFKLGAHDFILAGPGSYTDLVFSLTSALKHAATARLAAELDDELAALNRTLATQVAARTAELAAQVARSQALSARLLRVQEDERHALAHELHDQVGQLLTGLRFQLEAARLAPTGSTLGEALIVTDELLLTVRSLTLQLRPRLLDDLGLRPALAAHLAAVRHQTGLTLELELALPDQRLPAPLELAAYRVVQEALTNIARHSGASAAQVTVVADATALHIEVADHGRGFDAVAALARRDSLGLAGLAERVQLAGGRFELVSTPGHGTRVHAEFPLTSVPLAS
jgi:signal transduction histidine kinase